MYRVRDLIGLKVFDSNGKKLGIVSDLSIDYFNGKIIGFIMTKKLFSKLDYVDLSNVISLNENIVVQGVHVHRGLKFSEIKNFDLINKDGHMLGILEDILIDYDFYIKGLIIVGGFFDKFKRGKRVIQLKETILGEENILFFGNKNISMRMLPSGVKEEES
ncbi:PRC-barrel domain-containing protein [Clostridium sp. B9]|uniref:PRC-barrel domain-containing protein n=1 Tax=Clostridium sp. B9 TaxID=3423224 RepID=UPI003D2F24D8